jgi:hypothetical protein
VKLVPVIQIVEIDRILRGRAIIGKFGAPENAFSSFVVVIVTPDGSIVLFDCRGV